MNARIMHAVEAASIAINMLYNDNYGSFTRSAGMGWDGTGGITMQ